MPTDTLDPLAVAAEELAPAPPTTNFFDPAASQNIISRYSNSRIGMPEAEALAGASSRLANSRQDRIRQSRLDTSWDRDEVDYQDKQAFKTQRGEFLSQVGQIDPTADDYQDQRDALLKTLPPEAVNDDAFQAILHSRDAIAKDRIDNLQQQELQKEAIRARVAAANSRVMSKWADKGLSREKLEEFIDPETGEIDEFAAGAAATAAERDYKAGTVAQAQQFKREMKAEKDLTAAEKELRKIAQESLADTKAFVPQTEALRGKLDPSGKLKKADLEAKDPKAFEEARKWDSNQFFSELETARDTTEDAYVAKGGPSLTDAQKAKRRTLWRAAQSSYTAAPAAETAPPAAKPLDRETGMQLLKEAGGDKNKARELARAAGYTF